MQGCRVCRPLQIIWQLLKVIILGAQKHKAYCYLLPGWTSNYFHGHSMFWSNVIISCWRRRRKQYEKTWHMLDYIIALASHYEESQSPNPKGEHFIDKPLSVIRCTVCFVKKPKWNTSRRQDKDEWVKTGRV